MYAVCGGTSEVRLYRIELNAKQGKCLDKLTTLTTHRKEVIAISIVHEYVATIGKDSKLVLHKVNLAQSSSSVIAQKSVEVDATS